MVRKVCCVGSNKCWLLLIVTLNMVACLAGMGLVGCGIWFIDKLADWKEEDAKPIELLGIEISRREICLVALWIMFAVGFKAFLVEMLPMRAEVQQNPRILQVYRNWKVVQVVCEVLVTAYFAAFQLERENTMEILMFFGAQVVLTLFTIALVRRRTREVEDDVGTRVYTMPLELDELL